MFPKFANLEISEKADHTKVLFVLFSSKIMTKDFRQCDLNSLKYAGKKRVDLAVVRLVV